MSFAFEPDQEGETPFDLSGLKRKSIRNRQQLDVAEFANNLRAMEKYMLAVPTKRHAPFDYSWLLQLHREMFGRVWQWGGEVRTENLNIGIPYEQIREQLQQLVENLRYWEQHWPSLLEQAVHLHVEAVRIHPFTNGNGRWARMLANIWLHQHRHPLTAWPVDLNATTSEVRREYLEAIRAAIHHRDFDAILSLHQRLTPRASE